MPCYIITYDLRQPHRDYQRLYDAIKSYGTWAKITESTWAVITSQSASSIRDRLILYTDQDDRLFVIKSGVEAAWRNTIAKSEWLKTYL